MVCSLNLLQVAESESGSCSDRDSIRSEARCRKEIESASNSAGCVARVSVHAFSLKELPSSCCLGVLS